MSCDTEEDLTYTWNVRIGDLISLKSGEIWSPIFEAKSLPGSQWYLVLGSGTQSVNTQNVWCCVYRYKLDKSEFQSVSVTFKLEIIQSNGTTSNSIKKNGVSFLKGSSYKVEEFLTEDFFDYLSSDRNMWTDTLTIRCHIIDENFKKPEMMSDIIPTTIQMQWKIKTSGLSNQSKKIKVPLHDNNHIDIFMSPSNGSLNIKIAKEDLLKQYKLKLAVLNNEGRVMEFKDSTDLVQITDKKQDFEMVIDKSLISVTQSFTLLCDIAVAKENSESDVKNYFLGSSICKLGSPLQDDLIEMLLKEKHSDIKLRVHDEIVPAHKCLLSARSPVFAAMFEQDMLENQTGIVDIPDVESKTLGSFLEFMYTDKITDTDYNNVLKLLIVADKYQVNVLKERCSETLMSTLSLENVCELITVSDMVNVQNLKMCTINFIKKNKKDIISSPFWLEWVNKNTKIAVEVLSKLIID